VGEIVFSVIVPSSSSSSSSSSSFLSVVSVLSVVYSFVCLTTDFTESTDRRGSVLVVQLYHANGCQIRRCPDTDERRIESSQLAKKMKGCGTDPHRTG
jgi:hypothetical protein